MRKKLVAKSPSFAFLLPFILIALPAISSDVGDLFQLTPLQKSLLEGFTGFGPQRILDFRGEKQTWHCHWFPTQETRPGGDPINNRYALGGPLDKLDKVTGAKARDYEWNNDRKSIDEGVDYAWWGHARYAAIAACLLKEPKETVNISVLDGKRIQFTPNDIQGLLVKIMGI